jgi:bifunctional NMN adenylyltransferase/nudix hydrolase
MSKIENGVILGRFQPVHDGHMQAFKIAASQVKTLNILIGSANVCRSIKNPWTYGERVNMIRTRLFQQGITNIDFYPLNDYPYNDHRWITEVRSLIDHVISDSWGTKKDVVLFSPMKEGNDYLNWFPGIPSRSVPILGNLNATDIRNGLMSIHHPEIPQTVQADFDYYQAEKKRFAGYPYPETLNFLCGDAVVTCIGHVLLIERKHAPGMNTWALPGGFKENNETLTQTVLRELREETNLRVPEKVLLGSIKSSKLYDSPKRCHGIPRITYAIHFDVAANNNGALPDVRPKDDALNAKWVPLHEAINDYVLFDDHKAILSEMTGIAEDFAFLKD